jgi:hypothetical protein
MKREKKAKQEFIYSLISCVWVKKKGGKNLKYINKSSERI